MGQAGRLLEEFLDNLTPRQRFVVTRSWGLAGSPSFSFREIAEAIDVDVAAVYRCYSAAMRKLRFAAQEADLGQQLEGIDDEEDTSNHGPWFLYGHHDGEPGIAESEPYYLEWWDR
jgi:hypothetical protein